MFILNFNSISGKGDQKIQPNLTKPKIDDPDALLKPHIPVTDCPIYKPESEGIRPSGEDEKAGMKNIVMRFMLRAAGQLFTREKDPDPETLFKFMEKITEQEATEERKEAFMDFINAIREEKPDVQSHIEEYFQALSDTWNNGEFEGLPDFSRPWPVFPHRSSNND